jgi:hypothetical protein
MFVLDVRHLPVAVGTKVVGMLSARNLLVARGWSVRLRSAERSTRYGVASQFQVWSPLENTLPPVVHWLVSHTSPVVAERVAAGSGVAPP